MLYVKIMSGEDCSDDYSGKNFTLITLGEKDRMQFGEWGSLYPNPVNHFDYAGNTDVLIVIRENADEQETYRCLGNVYIMNHQGKTIATRTPRKLE